MKWTKEKPDREGVWWYTSNIKLHIPSIIKTMAARDEYGNSNLLYHDLTFGVSGKVKSLNGYWSDEPIPKPEGE